MFSLLFNYGIGVCLEKKNSLYFGKRFFLIIGIFVNLSLLAYFKYTNFFIGNISFLIGEQLSSLNIIFPLGISFLTFKQIAYLVDIYKKKCELKNFLNYSLFVTFFPQVILGPIIRHQESSSQFDLLGKQSFLYENIVKGVLVFSIGFFKKMVIADTLSSISIASKEFDIGPALTFFDAWIISLSYTFQLYFDFSGYTDMAIGSALLLGIKLPENFNSPYKAVNLQDFWRRWHITLSSFLRDYIYIPLGGSKKGKSKTYFNLLLTFILGGLWHGAGWTFIFWGLLHGFGLVIHRLWKNLGYKMNSILGWFITFNFVNFCWVFFKADNWNDAIKILKGMFMLNKITLPYSFEKNFSFFANLKIFVFGDWITLEGIKYTVIFSLIPMIAFIFFKNTDQIRNNFKPSLYLALFCAFIFSCAFLSFNKAQDFLYVNF